MKTATIIDLDDDILGLEYDNTLGERNTMRLEADSYEKAIREARSFLGIEADNRDADGTVWQVE